MPKRFVVYVATTRAADYLILSAAVSDLDKVKGHSLQLLKHAFDLLAGQSLRNQLQRWFVSQQSSPNQSITPSHVTNYSVQRILKELSERQLLLRPVRKLQSNSLGCSRRWLQRLFAVSRLTATLHDLFAA